VVNNKILPQVKRYGIVSEPTRAASEVSHTQHFVTRHPLIDHDYDTQFWKTFFYSAAFGQTALEPRHPDDADTSHAHGGAGYRHEEYEQTLTLDHTGMGDRTAEEDRGNEEDLSGLMTPDEHSFLYGNPIASTPLPKHHMQHLEGHPEQSSHGQGQGNAHGRSAHAHMNQPWAEGMSSMESPTPYASLERKMKEVLEDDDGMSSTAGSFLPEEIGLDTPKPGGSASGSRSGGYEPYQTPEGLDEEPSVLISRSDQSSSYHPPGEPSSAHKASTSRDLPDLPRFKPKMPSHFQSPKAHMNPFSPVKPGNKSGTAAWDGIADLRNTPLNPKIRPLAFNHNGNGNGNGANRNQAKNDRTPRRAPMVQQGGDDSFASDSDEEPQFGLAAGGTPPMTMNFGLPDRTIVSKTPAKEAAKAVIRNLMMDDEGMDSPGMPTPPAFSRFGGAGGTGSTSRSMSSSAGKGFSMSPSRSAGGRGKGGLFSHELDQRGDETIRDTMGRMELDESPLMNMTEPLPSSDLDQGQDPDVSTVGMPKHRRSTVPQLDFLDESFDDSSLRATAMLIKGNIVSMEGMLDRIRWRARWKRKKGRWASLRLPNSNSHEGVDKMGRRDQRRARSLVGLGGRGWELEGSPCSGRTRCRRSMEG
jgi:hypothetical protein